MAHVRPVHRHKLLALRSLPVQQVAPEGVVVTEGPRQPVQGGEEALPLLPQAAQLSDDGRRIELLQQRRTARAGEALQLSDGGARRLNEAPQPSPAQPWLVRQGRPGEVGAVEAAKVARDPGVAFERPRTGVRVSDGLEPEPTRPVGLRLDSKEARGSKPSGQVLEQTRAVGEPLAGRVVPRSRVGPSRRAQTLTTSAQGREAPPTRADPVTR